MAYTSVSGTTATSDWITTTYNPTTTTTIGDILTTTTATTATTAPSTVTITPDMVTSTYYPVMPTSINLSMIGEEEIDKKIKKVRDDVDKHVDELEQDLEYQNEQRLELERTVMDMGEHIAAQDELIDDLQTKLENAANQIRLLREQQQEYLNNNILIRICELEERFYEMDKRDMGQDK